MKQRIHIVFAGGGTGGHLFPGLAVAEKLRVQLPEVRITFAGSGRRLERQQVADTGLEYLATPCRPLPRRTREAFRFVADNVAGYLAARRFLAAERVDAVVGLGGYASVPLGQAASRWGVPLILLEQNAVAGRATRWLARRADLLCLAFPQARSGLRCRCPVYVTGNPLRAVFEVPEKVIASPPQLLVLGGSSGARSLNESVPRALYKLGQRIAGWQIVHQSGGSDVEATGRLYRQFGLQAAVVDFIADMPQALAASTLAVCRSGGTTLAELAAMGLPAVLVPYPHAADDHQRRNAEVLADAGAAVIVDERGLPGWAVGNALCGVPQCRQFKRTPHSAFPTGDPAMTTQGHLDDRLAEAISALLADPGRRCQMALAMRRLAQPDAAAWVAALICSLAVEGPCRAAIPAAA